MKKEEFEDLNFGDVVVVRDTSGKFRRARKVSPAHHSSLYRNQLWAEFEYLDTHRRVTKRMRQVRGLFYPNLNGQVKPDTN